MSATVEDRLRDFIVTELQSPIPRDELTDDLPLIDQHVIDSMGIFQLVSFLEREMGVEIEDDELVIDNFSTIGVIAGLVEAKRDAGPG